METVYYTPQEVADRLKLRVQTVYDYIRKGRLPAVRLGNRCRVAQSDLEAFLARQLTAPPPIPSSPGEGLGSGSARPVDPASAEPTGPTEWRDQKERNQAARRLLAEWLADESGYDERVWPVVEELIEQHPVSLGEPSE